MTAGAVISPCGRYRYVLARDLGLMGRGAVLFLMLNPSTADASEDDPTIRRCKGFAQTWGFARLLVGNLYAYRATDPSALGLKRPPDPQVSHYEDRFHWGLPPSDPVGPENDRHLIELSAQADKVVCAWGAHAKPDRVAHVVQLLGRDLHCIARTKAGAPALLARRVAVRAVDSGRGAIRGADRGRSEIR